MSHTPNSAPLSSAEQSLKQKADKVLRLKRELGDAEYEFDKTWGLTTYYPHLFLQSRPEETS